ncbi:hypothetical protein HAX54_032667 [Datura stramonium]|uniref:Uncharacterized protein n=1 Tax=Datura stramonium TaxID=4076 RepID=A0ABS8Y7R2_DATST|nr:hypothetical protein [Datura stramonium]
MGRKGKGGGRGRGQPPKILIMNLGSSVSARVNGASLDPTGSAVNQVMQKSLARTTPGSVKSPNPSLELLISGMSDLNQWNSLLNQWNGQQDDSLFEKPKRGKRVQKVVQKWISKGLKLITDDVHQPPKEL